MPATDKFVRVLVVDDEPSIADTLVLILNRSGYDSMAVYSAAEALKAARKFKPDTLLSDVTMPGMNGFELACHFAKHFSGCKVLLMTADHSPTQLARSLLPQGPVPRILRKPVSPHKLLAFVAGCTGPARS